MMGNTLRHGIVWQMFKERYELDNEVSQVAAHEDSDMHDHLNGNLHKKVSGKMCLLLLLSETSKAHFIN